MATDIAIVAKFIDEISQPAQRAREALKNVGDTAQRDTVSGLKAAATNTRTLGEDLDKTKGKGLDFGRAMKGAVAGIAALGATKAVKDFSQDSVKAFQDTAGAALKMQRSVGGSIEEASRLTATFKALGLDGDTATALMGKFSKALAGAKDSSKTLGVQVRDASGAMRPMSQLLPEIAEKFKQMPDGAEKTAAAMALFGKQGQAMLPFLNKGKAGIQELMDASDKYGLTISKDQVGAIAKAKAAQRDWNMANEGLKVQIGAQLLPLMTQMSVYIKDKVIPGIAASARWVKEHKDGLRQLVSVLTVIGPPLAAAVAGFMAFNKVVNVIKAVQMSMAALNLVMAANPIGLVVVAIAALVAGLVWFFTKTETGKKVWEAFTSALSIGWTIAVGKIMTGKDKIVEGWNWLTTKAGELKNSIGEKVDAIVGFFTGLPGRIMDGLSGLKDRIAGAFPDWLKGANPLGISLPGLGDTATSMASGGGLLNTLAGYRALGGGLGISNVWVGGGGRGYGSGDHQAGRALDLVGSGAQMSSFVARARGAGDFAELHGSGAGRHVHYVPRNDYAGGSSSYSLVPGGMGDTAASMAGGVYVAPGAVVVSGVSDPRAAAEMALSMLQRRIANARERR